MKYGILCTVVVWLFLWAVPGGPVFAQQEETGGEEAPGQEPQIETKVLQPGEEAARAPQALEGAQDEMSQLRTGLLEILRKGFPPDLPFFGFQFMGVAEKKPKEWKNLPIAPFYEVGVDDEILISAWGSFHVDLRLVVNEQGFVMLPGEKRVYVIGLKFDQLEKLFLEKLRQTYAEALAPKKLDSGEVLFRVTLGKVRGIQLMITGQVDMPGGYTFERPLVLLMDAFSSAGGISAEGGLRSIEVKRGEKIIQLDLYDLLTRGEIDIAAYLLRTGDVVSVPYRGRTVSIKGSVKRPAIYELKAQETLANLIEMAGGLTASVDRKRIQVKRIDPDKGSVLIDVDLTVERPADVKLSDGDQIDVSALDVDLRGDIVTVEGAGVIHPGTYELTKKNEELTAFLRQVGLYEDAVRDRIILIRLGPELTREKIVLNLEEAAAKEFRLQGEDHLFVSSKYQMRGGEKQIVLEGYVKNPGTYKLQENLTLSDVLFLYGGLTDPDFRSEAYLVRGDIIRVDKSSGAQRYLPFNLGAVLAGEEDLQLESNDTIITYPKSRFGIGEGGVFIGGEVRYPGDYPRLQDMTLEDLLVQAGLPTERAYTGAVQVNRLAIGKEPPVTSFEVPMSEMDSFVLHGGDKVFVRRIPFYSKRPKTVEIYGEVKFEGAYVLTEVNERLSHLVERTGGLSQEVFLEGATLSRLREGEEEERLQVVMDMEKALSGDEKYDIVLRGGDIINIPIHDYVIKVEGAVMLPKLAQYIAGKKSGYYVDLVGGYLENADVRASYIVRANGLFMKATRRLWFDPIVPPGSTVVIPEKKPEKPLWRNTRMLGLVGGALATGLIWNAAN